MKMKTCITIICLFISVVAFSQSQTKHILFLGNSYTYVNDLPQMLADAALSAGDTVIFDSNTPGGYTLQLHSTNALSLSKIANGNWDYVVLQEQSQLPSFPIAQVETDVFPFAHFLDSVINFYNPCVETAFYMTWGRKNGDASNCGFWPPVCTYAGMDSLLNLRYRMMADSNAAILSPVGAVWKYIRQNFPNIELYSADESHPSVEGTYAAACCFYASIFRKDPTLISFNSSLATVDADNIKAAAKLIVFDSLLNWHIGAYDPTADFNFNAVSTQVQFSNLSANATSYNWDFGDGNTSNLANPLHVYAASGSYNVKLSAAKCGIENTFTQTITINVSGSTDIYSNQISWSIYPNPASSTLTINQFSKGALSYKLIAANGQIIKSGSLSTNQTNFDLTAVSKGYYLIQLFEKDKLLGQQKFEKL
jgi:PKD repeat protein